MFSLHVDTARTWRGGQNQVLLTVLGLRAHGHRAALVAHPDGELRRRMSESTDFFPMAPRMEMDLLTAWNFSRLIRELQPDIVHAHDAHGVAMTALALYLGGSTLRARFVAARRVDFHVGKNAFSRWKYRQVECFICASAFIKSMLIDDGFPSDRTTVVYEGIDLANVKAAPSISVRTEFGFPQNTLLVGNVAALVPHKGQRYLVDAAALVVPKAPDVRFLIIGEGKLEATLRHQVKRLNLAKHVIFTGFRTDVLSLHKAFDIFVMSSVSEGLGTSALDAMACGRPVIATRAGGLPEVVDDGETGRLVPVRNATLLAAAIVGLLQDSALRERYGRMALESARLRFGNDRMINETVNVYRRVADTPRAADSGGPPVAD